MRVGSKPRREERKWEVQDGAVVGDAGFEDVRGESHEVLCGGGVDAVAVLGKGGSGSASRRRGKTWLRGGVGSQIMIILLTEGFKTLQSF